MKPMKRPAGSPIIACGCQWPLWVEQIWLRAEAGPIEHDEFRGCTGYISAVWYATNLRASAGSDPDRFRVTGKCPKCHEFFDIRNDVPHLGMHTMYLTIDSQRYKDPDNPWPRIVKGQSGIRFVYHHRNRLEAERRSILPTLDAASLEKLMKLDTALFKAHQACDQWRVIIARYEL